MNSRASALLLPPDSAGASAPRSHPSGFRAGIAAHLYLAMVAAAGILFSAVVTLVVELVLHLATVK